jgi:hypothetical protein
LCWQGHSSIAAGCQPLLQPDSITALPSCASQGSSPANAPFISLKRSNLDCYDFMFCTPPELSAQDPVFAELAKLDRLETL